MNFADPHIFGRKPLSDVSGYFWLLRPEKNDLPLRRIRHRAVIMPVWQHINLESDCAISRAAYHVFQKMHLQPTAQKEFRLSASSPLSETLFDTLEPFEFDRGTNSWSVTSRCLHIKYYCSDQLDRMPIVLLSSATLNVQSSTWRKKCSVNNFCNWSDCTFVWKHQHRVTLTVLWFESKIIWGICESA